MPDLVAGAKTNRWEEQRKRWFRVFPCAACRPTAPAEADHLAVHVPIHWPPGKSRGREGEEGARASENPPLGCYTQLDSDSVTLGPFAPTNSVVSPTSV